LLVETKYFAFFLRETGGARRYWNLLKEKSSYTEEEKNKAKNEEK
jgi:hypothetical protein